MSRSLIFFLLLSLELRAHAQEGKDPSCDFFKKSDIDFWGTDAKKKPRSVKIARSSSDKDLVESIFAEPTRMPDGRTAIYIPPREVLAFLEEPTRENARKYLEWQDARAKRIAAALEALDAVKLENFNTVDAPKRGVPRSEIRKTSTEKTPADAIRLTYFRQDG